MNIGKRIYLSNIWLMMTVFLKPSIMKNHALTTKFNEQQAKKRRTKPNTRADFFSHILSSKAENTSDAFLNAQSQTLIIAGSETTSTLLASLMTYMLKDEAKLDIMKQEIREAFKDSSEITSDATQKLPYLCACIEEALRIAPPVAFGLPRISPGAVVGGLYVPEGVSLRFTFIWPRVTRITSLVFDYRQDLSLICLLIDHRILTWLHHSKLRCKFCLTKVFQSSTLASKHTPSLRSLL